MLGIAARVMIEAGGPRIPARVGLAAANPRTAARVRLLAGAAIAVGFMQIACAKVSPATDTTAVRASPPTTVATPASPSAAAADSETQVAMRNVNFYIIPNAALRIRTLRGDFRSLKGGPVLFDDKTAFVIDLDYAEIGLNGNDLTTLMNNHIFAYPGAPLRRLKIHTSGSQVVQSGVMHKILDIPFEITADVSVTPEGLIKLHPVKTRILGVNGNDLMRAFNLSLEKILDLSKAKGVTVKGNDLFLDPVKILPPPAITGHATAIRVDGDELVQTFGSIGAKPPLIPPDTTQGAYMYYKGGTLRFGKLLMLDADMQIEDLRPTGFFSFSIDEYQKQLVAGYERTLANGGLLVYMLGLEKLGSASGPAAPPRN